VVHCSSATSPDLVARGVRLIKLARSRLGDELGRHVLLPIHEGKHHGLTYAITPYCTPLSTGRLGWRLQRLRLRTPLLDWTWGITNATATRVDAAKLDEVFLQPLVRIIQTPEMPDRIRTAARRGLSRLERGAWQPRCVLTHNDLWQGNVLIAPAGIVSGPNRSHTDRFVIIDWGGAMLEGYPFVDLAKLGRSLGLSTARFRREIERHCAALNCQSEDAVYSLLAGMGRLGMSLECFSIERYIKLTRASFDALSRLVEPHGTADVERHLAGADLRVPRHRLAAVRADGQRRAQRGP
jgi:hypothetical protein